MAFTGTVTVRRYRKDRHGTWRFIIDVNRPGKKRKKLVGGTRKEADLLAAKIRLEGLEAVLGMRAARTLTVDELHTMQLERDKDRPSSAADRQRWQGLLEAKDAHGKTILRADRTVDSIRPSDVVAIRTWLEAQVTRRKRPNAPATVNKYLWLLSRAMTIAIEDRATTDNPVKRDMLLEEDNERERVATKDEVRLLLDKANPQLRLAILIARCSTLRQGTIAALEWPRVDLDHRLVMILKRKRTKLARQSRPAPLFVPLSKRAVEALRGWKDMPETQARIAKGDQRVFTIKATTLSSSFADLVQRLKIADLIFHDLRHTATSELSGEGRLNTRELERTGDWAHGSAMLSRYDHPDMSRVLAALDTIDE